MTPAWVGWLLLASTTSLARGEGPTAFPVAIRIDAAKDLGAWRPIGRFFGADEPNYATMKDGRKLLGEIGALGPDQAYFRAHNLLTTGDGRPALKWGSTNVYTEDAQGRPVYDWSIVDGIFDAYLAAGVKPYVQIGFMPKALSTRPEPYQHRWTPAAKYDEVYTGWAYPPRDDARWAELVFRWASHCVERYGRAEVERWYWETWNEPNIGYWRGTPEEFYRLHDLAVDAVRRALPTARVGGPDDAGGGSRHLRDFLEHCVRGKNGATGRVGTPIDFVSFHAKGAPTFVDGHVRMGIANQLRDIDRGFAVVAGFPELKAKPIIIGESDPDGCAACQGPQLGYRNGTMYSSYTAASFARTLDLARKHEANLEGALTWAFEFEGQPSFAGFRVLATNGVDLPVMNVFRLLGKMGGRRVAAESDGQVALDAIVAGGVRGRADVGALASRDGARLSILLWHYHDDDLAGPDADVQLSPSGLPVAEGGFRVRVYRVDRGHSNAFEAWKAIGSPTTPTAEQAARLEASGKLAAPEEFRGFERQGGAMAIRLPLPRQGVALVVIEPSKVDDR